MKQTTAKQTPQRVTATKARQMLNKEVSHKQLKKMILDHPHRDKWLIFGPEPGQKGDNYFTIFDGDDGYVDLTLCHKRTGQVLFVELKTETDRLRPGQTLWRNALIAGDNAYLLIKPSNVDDLLRLL